MPFVLMQLMYCDDCTSPDADDERSNRINWSSHWLTQRSNRTLQQVIKNTMLVNFRISYTFQYQLYYFSPHYSCHLAVLIYDNFSQVFAFQKLSLSAVNPTQRSPSCNQSINICNYLSLLQLLKTSNVRQQFSSLHVFNTTFPLQHLPIKMTKATKIK